MDRIAEWRPVEPAGPDGTADYGPNDERSDEPTRATTKHTTSWRLVGPALLLLSVAGLAVGGAIVVLLTSTMPRPAVSIDAATSLRSPADDDSSPASVASPAAAADEVVVDVQGAVERAGVWRLPAGSRVGDAIAAAGGYSALIDIDAAARRLNLAQTLVDGQQIHVPTLGGVTGDPVAAAPTAGGLGSSAQPSGGAGGLIDINSAGPEELDTLPGIGPVTAAKIIAARQEAPFATIDELVGRGVVGQATFDKIRALIGVGG